MERRPGIDGLSIPQALARTAGRLGPREALVFPELRYRRPWTQLLADVRQAARAMMALGVAPGEHVGVWATNWPQWVTLQLAAAEIGAVLVNVNPAYRAHELGYVLEQANITTLFLTDRFKTTDYFAIMAELAPELGSQAPGELRSKAFPRLRRVISINLAAAPGMLSWPAFLRLAPGASEAALARRRAAVRPDDVANIQYTSGTTGFPKGAMLTHRNLLMNAWHVGERQAFGPGDRLCLPVPFYHCFGCVMGTLMCVARGATLVVPAEAFDAEATLKAIEAERCTGVYGVPTMFIAELNHPRFAGYDLSSLRTGVMAGSPCPIEVMREVAQRMGAREITIAYGLTEASPVITQTEASDPLEHRVSTVGRPLPGVEVMLAAPGTLDPARPGEPGELLARGHGIMKGYYGKPAETAAAVTPDGWLRTGDLASRAEGGAYKITGRLKDMIIRGGENVYPREIEEFLYTHPAVQDVQVVGLPDERMGEEVCAFVRLKGALDESGLREFCRGRIAHFKVPRYVVFVEQYPTTVTGKVQKYKLREQGIARFGRGKAAAVATA